MIHFLSICSGIEAASQAWKPLGWQAVGFSEIDPFACAVLAHHHPSVPNFGSLTDFPDDYTAIPWRGKAAHLCPDGPRYKALGNSMAVPVMRWIGARLCAYLCQ